MDDVSRVGRELLRVVVIGEVNEHLALGGGYTWTRVEDLAGNRVVEHRAVQQVDLRIPIAVGASVSSRTRLEERRNERVAVMAFRLREQIRLGAQPGTPRRRRVLRGATAAFIGETQ